MKKQEKKFVLAALALLAITGLLTLAGCKNDTVPEPTRYTVKFDKGDNSEYTGDLPADITVESGTKLTAEQLEGLADTADYIFEGWYDGETKAEGGTYTVTKDVTLVAKWRDRGTVASVAFTPAGGALDYGDTVTLSSQEGATIHYTVNDGEEKTGDSPVTVSVTGDTTITARATKDGFKDSEETKATYTLKRYTVTFDTNGGTFADGEDTKTETVESGQTIEKPLVTYPVTKNELYRWKDESGEAVSFPLKVEKNMTLTAEWGIKVGDTVYPKTSEVQVLSEAVNLSSLYVVDSEGNSVSEIFVENRVDSIQPFVMGQYEVTQQLYEAVMGSNPSNFTSDVATGETQELRPVEMVSWYDAVVFCNELTKKVLGEDACVYYSDAGWKTVYTTGDGASEKTPYMNISKSGYRLPTEAEWELAARGGDPKVEAWKYTYAGSSTIDGVAWYSDNSTDKTHQVGTKAANSLSLYDMSGNVCEWCWDWHGSIEAGTASGGVDSGSYRVRRGGSWGNSPLDCAVSYRGADYPHSRNSLIGLRLVRSAN